jgi:ABC-type glycerol-3-phosphate transport system substrate-binding protein
LQTEERVFNLSFSKDIKIGIVAGSLLTCVAAYSILDFSKSTFSNKILPIDGVEVVSGIYKFDLPFLGDKYGFENTIKAFEEKHPELKINYIYTGPDELNTKKKTHMLLYVFTEERI